jgi:hypothetical protein
MKSIEVVSIFDVGGPPYLVFQQKLFDTTINVGVAIIVGNHQRALAFLFRSEHLTDLFGVNHSGLFGDNPQIISQTG